MHVNIPSAGPAGTPRLRPNPLGIASLVAGVLMTMVTILEPLVYVVMPDLMTLTSMSSTALSYLLSAPGTVLALFAAVLGVIGLLQRGRARTAAIIGTTLGVPRLLFEVTSTLVTVLIYPLLG